MGVSKTSNHIQMKIKMPNPSQEPQASSKAQNKDVKDIYVFWTCKTKKGSQIQIKINMPNPSKESSESSKDPD